MKVLDVPATIDSFSKSSSKRAKGQLIICVPGWHKREMNGMMNFKDFGRIICEVEVANLPEELLLSLGK